MQVRSLLIMSMLVALVLSSAAYANSPKLRLCTGKKGNNYFGVGVALASKLKDVIGVEVIETEGSWANLAAIDAEPPQCDAIIAQDDAAVLYEFENPKSTLMMDRMATLYPEFVHVLCQPDIGIKRVAELDPKKHRVLINRYGSGTYVTWKLVGRLNPAYAAIPIREVGLEEGLKLIKTDKDAQCLVAVSGVHAGAARMANDSGSKLILLALDDETLHRAVGRQRRAVYRSAKIPEDAYPKLLTDDMPTQAVTAVFFLSPEWHARHPEQSKKLRAAVLELAPTLKH